MARRLGTILVDMGYLDEEGLWKVIEEQKRSENELIGKVAVRLGLVQRRPDAQGAGRTARHEGDRSWKA